MSSAIAVAAAGLLFASTLQSATGFGFALVAGPAFYAAFDPTAAVALVLVLAAVVEMLVLFAERRQPDPEWSAVLLASVAALPGLPLGALLVRTLPTPSLRILVGLVVVSFVAARVVRRRGEAPAASIEPDRHRALAAGFAVGVLTTSTTTAGPPLAIWLTGRRMPAAILRDTVTVIFFALDLIGIAVLVAVLGAGATFAQMHWLPLLVPIAVYGQVLGRHIFLRLPTRRYELVVLAFALAAGILSVATGIR
jgi:uncharacterized membrane protein YfcA